jgi:ribosomal protein S4
MSEMKINLYVCLLILLIGSPVLGQHGKKEKKTEDIKIEYRQEYQTALGFVQLNKKNLVNKITEYGADYEVCAPIIFPELLRYSIIWDQIETSTLKIFYVTFGEDYADFSIGRFQMKPSFIRHLEEHAYLIEQDDLRSKLLIADKKEDKAKRIERIARLEDVRWQTFYLAMFYRIVNAKYSETLSRMPFSEKIRFFATAYNYGFHFGSDYLIKRINQKLFPDGKNTIKPQYCYGDLALFFYNDFWKEFISGNR